jgi:alanine dehydrogenase
MLPLLYPMSEVAGCLAPQVGAHAMMKAQGGRGVLMGGVGGVANAKVVVLGAGVAGPERRQHRARHGRRGHPARHRPRQAADELLALRQPGPPDRLVVAVGARGGPQADMVIGTVLIPGAKAPKLVTDDMVAQMKPGSVLVDVAIDQGGCFEGSRPTTHADPTFPVHNSIYYCVANMPGAVPNTSTWALTNATLPYAVKLADKGWQAALHADKALALGLNTHGGRSPTKGVADAFGMPFTAPDEVLA